MSLIQSAEKTLLDQQRLAGLAVYSAKTSLALLEQSMPTDQLVLESALNAIGAVKAIVNNKGDLTKAMPIEDWGKLIAGLQAVISLAGTESDNRTQFNLFSMLKGMELKRENGFLKDAIKYGAKFKGGTPAKNWTDAFNNLAELVATKNVTETAKIQKHLLTNIGKLETALTTVSGKLNKTMSAAATKA